MRDGGTAPISLTAPPFSPMLRRERRLTCPIHLTVANEGDPSYEAWLRMLDL